MLVVLDVELAGWVVIERRKKAQIQSLASWFVEIACGVVFVRVYFTFLYQIIWPSSQSSVELRPYLQGTFPSDPLYSAVIPIPRMPLSLPYFYPARMAGCRDSRTYSKALRHPTPPFSSSGHPFNIQPIFQHEGAQFIGGNLNTLQPVFVRHSLPWSTPDFSYRGDCSKTSHHPIFTHCCSFETLAFITI